MRYQRTDYLRFCARSVSLNVVRRRSFAHPLATRVHAVAPHLRHGNKLKMAIVFFSFVSNFGQSRVRREEILPLCGRIKGLVNKTHRQAGRFPPASRRQIGDLPRSPIANRQPLSSAGNEKQAAFNAAAAGIRWPSKEADHKEHLDIPFGERHVSRIGRGFRRPSSCAAGQVHVENSGRARVV